MTVSQIFENAALRKTVWTKSGGDLTKRSVSSVSSVKPRNKIATVKGPTS
jgi:hypothetical protein